MNSIYLATGLLAGVLSGLFGIGGGIVIIPILLFAAHMQPRQAIGTSLGALLLPVGALAAWTYYRAGELNVKASLLIAAGLFAGAWMGAQMAMHMEATLLRKLFSVLLGVVAIKTWFG